MIHAQPGPGTAPLVLAVGSPRVDVPLHPRVVRRPVHGVVLGTGERGVRNARVKPHYMPISLHTDPARTWALAIATLGDALGRTAAQLYAALHPPVGVGRQTAHLEALDLAGLIVDVLRERTDCRDIRLALLHPSDEPVHAPRRIRLELITISDARNLTHAVDQLSAGHSADAKRALTRLIARNVGALTGDA